MLVGELEGLHQTEVLVDVTANGGIVEGQVSQDAIVVDDVSGSAQVRKVKRKSHLKVWPVFPSMAP